jgi:hypothetical protein
MIRQGIRAWTQLAFWRALFFDAPREAKADGVAAGRFDRDTTIDALLSALQLADAAEVLSQELLQMAGRFARGAAPAWLTAPFALAAVLIDRGTVEIAACHLLCVEHFVCLAHTLRSFKSAARGRHGELDAEQRP